MKTRIPELDGLRGIAILLVVFAHFASNVFPNQTFYGFASLGVIIFFVLSGFLIGGIILDEHTRPDFFRSFYTRRVARIVPIYLAVVCAAFIAARLVSGRAWADADPLLPFWVYLTFTTNFAYGAGSLHGLLLMPAWSLAIEEQFYILAPIVIIFTPRRFLPSMLLGICGAAFAFRYLLRSQPLAMEMLLPCRMDALALGVLAAHMQRTVPLQLRVVPLLTAAFISIGLLLLISTARPSDTNLYGFSLLPLSVALLLLAAINGVGFAALLRGKALRYFGEISYGLYLLHQPILVILTGLIAGVSIETPSLARIPIGVLAFGVSVALSTISWRYFERPIIRWAKKRIAEPSLAAANALGPG